MVLTSLLTHASGIVSGGADKASPDRVRDLTSLFHGALQSVRQLAAVGGKYLTELAVYAERDIWRLILNHQNCFFDRALVGHAATHDDRLAVFLDRGLHLHPI